MLKHEAIWLQRQLAEVPAAELSPLVSVGSGTAVTRARQWWIETYVYEPLAARGVEVVHHEHMPAEGVDIAGDVADPELWDRLAAVGPRTVLCANVLEHVVDRAEVAKHLASLTPAGGRLLVTVPRRYPYHPDPIDTMYRPTVAELTELFPDLALTSGADVECWSLASYALAVRGKSTMVCNGIRSVLRRDGDDEDTTDATAATASSTDTAAPPGNLRDLLPYVFGRTSVTCSAFRRPLQA